MAAMRPAPLTSAEAEISDSHAVMEPVRTNSVLSRLVVQLRDAGRTISLSGRRPWNLGGQGWPVWYLRRPPCLRQGNCLFLKRRGQWLTAWPSLIRGSVNFDLTRM